MEQGQKNAGDGLIEGRIVHYVLPEGRSRGSCRPGIVVLNWGAPFRAGGYQQGTACNLQVFLDGSNDQGAHESDPTAGLLWATSVPRVSTFTPGELAPTRTWHWPSECPHYHGAQAAAGVSAVGEAPATA